MLLHHQLQRPRVSLTIIAIQPVLRQNTRTLQSSCDGKLKVVQGKLGSSPNNLFPIISQWCDTKIAQVKDWLLLSLTLWWVFCAITKITSICCFFFLKTVGYEIVVILVIAKATSEEASLTILQTTGSKWPLNIWEGITSIICLKRHCSTPPHKFWEVLVYFTSLWW